VQKSNIQDCRITNNILSNNNKGIFFTRTGKNKGARAKYNIISGNYITDNNIGIDFDDIGHPPRDNLIYNNFFENNAENAIDSRAKNNKWNTSLTSGNNIIGGPSIGGNYWGNFCTLDDGSGTDAPYDNAGDGIGDTEQYTIEGTEAKDFLPLTLEKGCKSWLYAEEFACISADGDSDPESCEASQGEWKAEIASNPCCGDDKNDFGMISLDGNYSCIKNTTGEWEWIYSLEAAAYIFHISYQKDYDILAGLGKFYLCDAKDELWDLDYDQYQGTVLKQGNTATVSNRDFICYLNKSIEQFGECSPFGFGSQNDNFPTYGTAFTAGDTVQSTTSSILETETPFSWNITKLKTYYTPTQQIIWNVTATPPTYTSIVPIGESIDVQDGDKIIIEANDNTGAQFNLVDDGGNIQTYTIDEDLGPVIEITGDIASIVLLEPLNTYTAPFKLYLNYTQTTSDEILISSGRSTIKPLEMFYGPKYLGIFDARSCEDDLAEIAVEYRVSGSNLVNVTFNSTGTNITSSSYNKIYATIPIPNITDSDIQTVSQTYYCGANGRWHTDLDMTDEMTCIRAGFEWTGSQCCGDDIREATMGFTESIKDTYNDKGWIGSEAYTQGQLTTAIGGCYNGKKVKNNSRIGDYNIIKNSSFNHEDELDLWEGDNLSIDNNNYLTVTPGAEIFQNLTKNIIRGKQYRLTANLKTFSDSHVNISITAGNQELAQISSSGYTGDDPVQKTIRTPNIPDTGDIFVRIKYPLPYSENPGGAYVYNLSLELETKDIMNYNGSFYGCNMGNEREDILNNSRMILIPEEKNMQSCEVLGSYFCAPSGSWQNASIGAPTAMGTRDTPKQIPAGYSTELIRTSCCAADYCWNGNMCVPTETNSLNPINPLWLDPENQTKGYLCKDGNWSYTEKKHTWDKSKAGFCPSITECLVNPDGNPNNNYDPEAFEGINSDQSPQCINSGQFIGDHYCENGNWSSRTKFIALQLINLTEKDGINDYVLFCDHYKKTLNDYSYSSKQDYLRGTSGNDFIGYRCDLESEFECVNNFCILKYNDKVAFGTSLNKPVNDSAKSFLNALDFNNINLCDSALSGPFEKCDEDIDGLWYSSNLNSVIFSNQDIDLEPITIWDRIINLFIHPVNTITGLWSSGAGDLFPAKDYNRIYLSTVGGKRITGIIEKPESDQELISITYKDFDEDICTSIEDYQSIYSTQTDPTFICTHNESENTYNLLTDDDSLLNSWPDLTSKLRVS
ncbi:hypothetical protein GF361_04435, partial [Candidatus Woesearchaeota archaeon]|nr:hypothetical protein [Candidatus Woesearchaeota archaeon]